MDASGSSSHKATTKENMVLEEDSSPEPAESMLAIAAMNPPL